MSKSITVVDSTIQLEWEMTKEDFHRCDIKQYVTSPLFNLKVNDQESKWEVKVYPKGNSEKNKNKVQLFLYNRGRETHVAYFTFTVKTPNGSWPMDAIEKIYSIQDKRKEDTLSRNENKGYSIGSTEIVRGQFDNDKITFVATLVIYGKGKEYLQHSKVATDFMKNYRSISDFETLSNVTLVCQGKRFQCHKNVLASMSSFFKTKFTNGNFSDGRARVVKIEDSTSETVEKMINFLSTGLIPEDIDETARELIKLSTFYGIDSLTSVCEKALIKTLSAENVIETFVFFDQYLPTSENRQKILDFIKENKNEVVALPNWTSFCTNHPNLVAETIKSF